MNGIVISDMRSEEREQTCPVVGVLFGLCHDPDGTEWAARVMRLKSKAEVVDGEF